MEYIKLFGLVMACAGFSVAGPVTSLSSEFNSEHQFESYNSRASNTKRKLLGHSSYFGSQEGYGQRRPHKSYNFDYKVADGQGNTHYHKAEADDKGTVRGMYGYRDFQGLYRIVDYIADTTGFHAKIKTNEPGIGGRNPSYVEIFDEQEPAVFPRIYSSPIRIHQDERIRDQNRNEERTETINKDDEPPPDVPRSMAAAVNQGFRSSSFSEDGDEK